MKTSAMRMEGRFIRPEDIALQNNGCHRVMLSVTKCDKRRSNAALCGKLLRWPRKNEKWFAAWFFANVEIAPAHGFADSGAEGFRNSFFRREARRQMARREFHRHRIFDFTVGENTVEKSISETIDGMLNARAFDKIDTDAEHAHPE